MELVVNTQYPYHVKICLLTFKHSASNIARVIPLFIPRLKGSGDIAMCLASIRPFLIRSITWKPFGIFWWYFTVMLNRSWWCVAYKNESPHLNSPLMLFYASCPLCNLNTLWDIIMILHSYVEQAMTMCHVQEWQLSLSHFLSYFPLMVSVVISCPLHNLKTVWNILIILYSYVEQVRAMCCIQEWQPLRGILSELFPLWCFLCNFVSTL